MRRRFVVAATLSALVTGPAAVAAPQPSPPAPHVTVSGGDPDTLLPATPTARSSHLLRSLSTPPVSTCAAPAAQAVPDGQPIRVVYAPAPAFTIGDMDALWEDPPVSEPAWQLWFYAFRWIGPLVRRAVDDGQTQSRDALVGQVVHFYEAHPDTGSSALGWDEGSSLRRLETLNCLYRLTSDARLVPAMEAEAAVQFGPRYYGPPRFRVHNHGLMANLALTNAGRLVGRPDWVARASARMRAESAAAFTPLGTTYEQSSSYQLVNIALWRFAADALAAGDPNDPTVQTIRATVARAEDVVRWYTEPDGRIVQFGDAERVEGLPWPGRRGLSVFRDDRAGLVVGRSDWNSPSASLYTLRYGPRRWAHGHPDTNTLTWTSRGTRVLIGSGYVGNEPSDPLVAWQKKPEANNAAIPQGRALDPDATGTIRAASTRGSVQSWTLTDRAFRVPHTRAVTVVNPRQSLTVADSFVGARAADQVWHLAPEWVPVTARPGSSTLTFRNARGRVLTVTTTGRLAGLSRGAQNPVAGWTFPGWGQRVPTTELRIRWTSGTATTTFQVR